MCFGSGSAAAQAAVNAAQQQSQINQNVNNIQAAFSPAATAGQYTQYANALTQSYQAALQRQQQLASRNLNFAMARSGLTGGSAAADQAGLLQQESALGTLNAQQQVQGKVAALQQQNAQTEAQLMSVAQTGGYMGDAAQETASALQANLGNAMGNTAASGLGNVFGNTANLVNNMNTASALRQGMQTGAVYANPFAKTNIQ